MKNNHTTHKAAHAVKKVDVVLPNIDHLDSTSSSELFGGFTREQFIVIEMLKASANLSAVKQVIQSTNGSEKKLLVQVLPAVTAAIAQGSDPRAVAEAGEVIAAQYKADKAGEASSEIFNIANIVKAFGVPLDKVTLADLV